MLMMFLLLFAIPYWLFGAFFERMKERREEKKAKLKEAYLKKFDAYFDRAAME